MLNVMPRSRRHEFPFTQALPQRRVQRPIPPTPPGEDEPLTAEVCQAWRRSSSKAFEVDNGLQEQGHIVRLGGAVGQRTACEYQYALASEEMSDGSATQQREQSEFDLEWSLWKAHCEDLRTENEHLRHIVYINALDTAQRSTPETVGSDRSETRNLRQQLACMGEQCQSLTEKMTRLQEQTAEAYRLLALERKERLEERNNQLTVVVAKHGLERRMRNREQDLQAEWRKNAELSERCQRLEEDLARARDTNQHEQTIELPVRGKVSSPLQQDMPVEDDWTDRPSHVPPEFGYSKLVRWKKRTREVYDHGVGHGKKQRMTAPEERGLQLAGSESPPQVGDAEQAGPGVSAIDHMIAGEFTESESPSCAKTPPEV